MYQKKIAKLLFFILSFTLVFNQQVMALNVFIPMSNSTEVIQKTDKMTAKVKMTVLQTMSMTGSEPCFDQTCYIICELNSEFITEDLLENTPHPIYTDSSLSALYSISYSGIIVNELFKPPSLI